MKAHGPELTLIAKAFQRPCKPCAPLFMDCSVSARQALHWACQVTVLLPIKM